MNGRSPEPQDSGTGVLWAAHSKSKGLGKQTGRKPAIPAPVATRPGVLYLSFRLASLR
jgi:hypothetical protein